MLKNKDIALVTGAGGGIGAAIALELSKQKYTCNYYRKNFIQSK